MRFIAAVARVYATDPVYKHLVAAIRGSGECEAGNRPSTLCGNSECDTVVSLGAEDDGE
jgi:hypothetical protein